MPKRPAPKITEELCEEILIWYALNQSRIDKHAACAKHFDLSRRTVSKLWFEGNTRLKKAPLKESVDTVETRGKAERARMKAEALAEANAEIDVALNRPADIKAAVAGTEPRVNGNALVAASRKSLVIAHTIVAEMLQAVYRRLPDIQEEISTMDGKKAIDLMSELRQNMTSLATASKLTMDMEKMEQEAALQAPPPDRSITNPEQATRVLALASRFVERTKLAPIVILPADRETTSTKLDDVIVPEQDADDEILEDDDQPEWSDPETDYPDEDDTEPDAED